jgi:predicted nucleotidyltransferase
MEPPQMSSLLPLAPDALQAFCRQHHIERLSVFGSVLKGTSTPGSDIDLLVEFEKDHVPGLIALASMELELSKLLGGRKVDLRTANDLSRHFREEVMRTARVEYAA